MSDIINLKPEIVWYYFNEICQIPRPSREKITAWLMEFGKKHNLETICDAVGNVLIRKPATLGRENSKAVVLQSHTDMVCEKNEETKHDFDHDPIKPVIDGEWVKATGTTLGADDGIGMAAQLAILAANDISHGPLECLFTVDEETGLTGAFALQPGYVKGRVLLNLDSEDEGQLFIGCAGGKDTEITFAFKKENVPARHAAYKVTVSGLKGGHSGDDINKGLGNAVKIVNRFLYNSSKEHQLKLSKLDAGNLRNAIAREGTAIVVIPEANRQSFINYASWFNDAVRDELKVTEPELKFTIEEEKIPYYIIDTETQLKLLRSLYACPHGVIAMTADMPGLVETSTNLASVKTLDDKIIVQTSQRSSVETSMNDIAAMVASVFELAGTHVRHGEGYPRWKPNLNSELLKVIRDTYVKLFHKDPSVLAIHAGLECGVIGEKYPGMDMISFGPTLRGVHSPTERLNIETVGMFWNLLVEALAAI